MSQGTTTRREAPCPQPANEPARRRPALPVVAAGVAALVLLAALAGIAAAVGGGPQVSAASPSASPSAPPATPSTTASAAPTPVWRLSSYRRVGFDKTFKVDLIDQLPSPPELVVFGGSRAMRFSPSYITGLSGLSAFNGAVQCFRPEDAWAFSSYLLQRSPRAALRDRPAGAHAERRPHARRAPVRPAAGERVPQRPRRRAEGRARQAPEKGSAGREPYTARGYLVRNRYDISRQRRYDFDHHWSSPSRACCPITVARAGAGGAGEVVLREDGAVVQRARVRPR